jgi:hypothetical protein
MKLRIDMVLYGAALLAAVFAAVWAIAARPAEPHAEPQPAAQEAKPVREEPEEAEPVPVPSLPEVPDLASEPPPPRPEGDPRMNALGGEMRFLSRARELLPDQPAQALDILEEHRREYPDGVLAAEREAFAIEALVALDRRAEAERRYTDFLRRYPSSPLAPNMR